MTKTTPERVSALDWLRGLDGIRGIACVTVVTVHVISVLRRDTGVRIPAAAIWYAFGTQSLTMFFCLSGFLLYRPWAMSVIRGKKLPNLRDYYTARAFRIMPANWLILIIGGLILAAVIIKVPPPPAAMESGRMTDPGMFLANMFLIQGFFPQYVLTGMSASWSLCVEITFYLLLPALGWMAWKAGQKVSPFVATLLPCALLIVVGSIGRQIGIILVHDPTAPHGIWYGANWETVFQRSFLSNADLIGLGMLVAAVVAKLMVSGAREKIMRSIPWICYATIIVSVLAAGVIQDVMTFTPIMGFAAAAVLLLLTMPKPSSTVLHAKSFLEIRLIRHLGEISYSLYLWHYVVILFLANTFPTFRFYNVPSLLLLCLVVVVIAAVLASLTFRFVEEPAMRHARTLADRRKQAQLAAAS